jgi:lipoprotein-releasing system permease protein
MFRPAEIFIGLRYSISRRSNHFISFNSLISMAGIAVGVTALITVLSVMNGFEKELRQRILGVVSHVSVLHEPDGLAEWQSVAERLRNYPHVQGAAPFIDRQAMLSQGGNVSGCQIRGIDPATEPQVSTLAEHMVNGRLAALKAGEFGIILGSELANKLGVRVGDNVMLVSPQTMITAVGILPRLKRFSVVGIFEIDMRDYDNGLALIHIEDAARLFRMHDRVSGVRLKLDDLFQAPYLSDELIDTLPFGYQVGDWTRQNANFFRAVKMEKTVMFAILILIIAVAAFNLVSTLVIMVADKQSDIAILRTLGFGASRIMRIFVIQGLVIGVIGTMLGVLGGVSLAQNIESIVPALEHLLGIRFLSPDVYYIAELPSDMRWSDVTRIATVSLVLCLVATLYPAWRAARTQPAEALRYE